MVTNVLEYLERSAQRFPDKIVFGDTDREVTYRQLLDLARRAGSFLASRHLRNQPIAVISTHSTECLIVFLGIVYSGNFYVPLDAKLPRARMEAILEVAKPGMVIVPDRDAVGALAENIPAAAREELFEWETDDSLLEQIRKEHLDVNPLYLMFTSGSTGTPKGVLISHRSVIDLAEQFAAVFRFDETDVFANQAPFDFDVSVKDIYCTLRNGASMYIVPQTMFSMPKKLIPYLNEHQVTVCIWAVSALSVLTVMKVLDREIPRYIKKIMFSGEVMPVKVLNYWRVHLPQAMYVNLYGPTEITCNCTYYIGDRVFELQDTIPIGEPFANTQILLLDEQGKEAAPGKTGEICVKGSCLALGYYRNRQATEAAFSQNPLHHAYPDLVYHTGDYGRYDEQGQLVFAARRDWQIKHMGHRIELAEIESAVNTLDWIASCCCQYDRERGKIILIYQAQEPCDARIAEGLRELLPKYMCPNRYIWLPRLPLNQRGKIDRVFLKKKYAGRDAGDEGYLYREAVILGTGTLALRCAGILEQRGISYRIYDTGDQVSRTLERQARQKQIEYHWRPRGDLTAMLCSIQTPTLVISAINPWILPKEVLENPYLEPVNCHQALLPAHPGRNAEMWAIFEEDEKTGITWHRMGASVDGGDVLIQKECALDGQSTAIRIFRRQIALAGEAFDEIADSLLQGEPIGRPQSGEPGRLRYSWEMPEDGELDLSWPFHKISAFLRSLDYGGLPVVKQPFLVWKGQRFSWKGYRIEEQEGGEEKEDIEQDHFVIRRREGRITLRYFVRNDAG